MVKRGWNLTSSAGPGSDSLYITHLLMGSIADIPIFPGCVLSASDDFYDIPGLFQFCVGKAYRPIKRDKKEY